MVAFRDGPADAPRPFPSPHPSPLISGLNRRAAVAGVLALFAAAPVRLLDPPLPRRRRDRDPPILSATVRGLFFDRARGGGVGARSARHPHSSRALRPSPPGESASRPSSQANAETKRVRAKEAVAPKMRHQGHGQTSDANARAGREGRGPHRLRPHVPPRTVTPKSSSRTTNDDATDAHRARVASRRSCITRAFDRSPLVRRARLVDPTYAPVPNTSRVYPAPTSISLTRARHERRG